MNITDEMVEAFAADWGAHDCGPGDCCTRAGLERVAPLIAAQALREAAEAHARYDEGQDDYVSHEDRCGYGPPPCECAKGETARWLNCRADDLAGP